MKKFKKLISVLTLSSSIASFLNPVNGMTAEKTKTKLDLSDLMSIALRLDKQTTKDFMQVSKNAGFSVVSLKRNVTPILHSDDKDKYCGLETYSYCIQLKEWTKNHF